MITSIETVIPCSIGDPVWGIRRYKGQDHAQLGCVSEIYFTDDMRLMIAVKHICRGEWNKVVFGTKEAALEALRRMGTGE